MDSSSLFISPLFSLLLFFLFLHLPTSQSLSFNTTTTYPPPPPTNCHQEERNALLEFKANFLIIESCIPDPDSGANLTTWTVEDNNGDCCNWSGVVCDQHTGHVIELDLGGSCLSGSINSSSSIFKLTHLQWLDLSFNDFRYSTIPSAISNLSRLEYLSLVNSNFSGQIPSEILNLTNLFVLYLSSRESNQLALKNPSLRDLVQSLLNLELLYLGNVEISSPLPDSLFRLTSLQGLGLSGCKLQGQVPPSLANLTKLEDLSLSDNQFQGHVPPSVANLTKLEYLSLSYNQFTSEIFPHLLTLTNLRYLYLSSNKFSGQIPRTISHLKNLTALYLDSNDFSGKTHLDVFFQLDRLERLDLSYNNLSSFVIDSSSIKPRSKLQYLILASCNLKSFPLLIQGLDSLSTLDLSSNDISGEVPQWFRDVTMGNLHYLNFSHNHLSGLLPIPSTNLSLQYYIASNNEFSGELPMRMCDLVNIAIFDVGNNGLSGEIPKCLANLVGIGNLFVLNLQNNNFYGPIPQVGQNTCNLVMIDMSYNQLEGLVPTDMENCSNLEFLNLGNNKINDVFPFWLGKFSVLSMLILRYNRFHGIIRKPFGGYEFSKLQVIDLSNNNFTGCLPTQYFEGWMAMKVDAHEEDRTMSYASYVMGDYGKSYFYTVMVTDKGIDLEYSKIPRFLTGVILSRNHFTGEIAKSIASLKGLYFLNLSHNMLTGSIPFNLNGLTKLKSLDLSHNNLLGEIPQQLTDLTTLESFDVSFNQLTGPIPQSKQFDTFDNSSYLENSDLCGFPLSRKCGSTIEESPQPSLEKDHALRIRIEFNWKIISMGYICGFVYGVFMGMNWTKGCKRVKKIRQIRFILS